MKTHIKIFACSLLLMLYCNNYSRAVVPGLDQIFQTALVTILTSIESFSASTKSKTAEGAENTKKLANSLEKVTGWAKKIHKKFKQSRLVKDVTMELLTITQGYLNFIINIFKHKDLLIIEEIELVIRMADYTVYNKRSFDSKGTKTQEDIGGMLGERINDVIKMMTSFDDVKVIQQAEQNLRDMLREVRRIRYDLDLVKKYAKSVILYKRYQNGYYDTPQYYDDIYNSEYRVLAEYEANVGKKGIIKIFN